MNQTTGLLQTRGLTLGYPQPHTSSVLFQNLDLNLVEGQLVCLMGPNGSGKSTLIRTLAGLQSPLSGEIVFAGPEKRRADAISVVLTDRIASTIMTARELIAFGRYPFLRWTLWLTPRDEQAINQAIAYVHVQHLVERKIDELSDGELQMIMIARALAQDTPLLLLDEPTAHLDLNNRIEIMNLLRRLSRTARKAILVATHELDLALQTADVVWLATGKRIKAGIPEDLVLDGSFDDVFQLKGYDLKTGKVNQEPHRGVSIRLSGEGPAYLWTKNALERSGFQVGSAGTHDVNILAGEKPTWHLDEKKELTTLADLLTELTRN